jgi:hypothetical protein
MPDLGFRSNTVTAGTGLERSGRCRPPPGRASTAVLGAAPSAPPAPRHGAGRGRRRRPGRDPRGPCRRPSGPPPVPPALAPPRGRHSLGQASLASPGAGLAVDAAPGRTRSSPPGSARTSWGARPPGGRRRREGSCCRHPRADPGLPAPALAGRSSSRATGRCRRGSRPPPGPARSTGARPCGGTWSSTMHPARAGEGTFGQFQYRGTRPCQAPPLRRRGEVRPRFLDRIGLGTGGTGRFGQLQYYGTGSTMRPGCGPATGLRPCTVSGSRPAHLQYRGTGFVPAARASRPSARRTTATTPCGPWRRPGRRAWVSSSRRPWRTGG